MLADLPLLLHVLGSMLAVGTLAAAVLLLAGSGSRHGYRTLLLGVVPSYVLMRASAQWIYAREFDAGEQDPAWIRIGFMVTDMGAVLLVLALVLAWLAGRRGSRSLSRTAAVLSGVLLAAYLIAVWAMTVKPD